MSGPRIGFNIGVSAVHFLSISEIWPDGDAPEFPTVEDVIRVIRSEGKYVIQNWDLSDGLVIEVEGQEIR